MFAGYNINNVTYNNFDYSFVIDYNNHPKLLTTDPSGGLNYINFHHDLKLEVLSGFTANQNISLYSQSFYA